MNSTASSNESTVSTSNSMTGIFSLAMVIVFSIRKRKFYTVMSKDEYKEFEEKNTLLGSIDEIRAQKEDALKEVETAKEEGIESIEALKQEELDNLEELKKEKIKELEEIKEQIIAYDKDLLVKYVDERDYSDITSTQIKNDLAMLNLKTKEMIKNDEAVKHKTDETKRRINNLTKQILKNFNTEVDLALSKLTFSNVDSIRGKVMRAFTSSNRIFKGDEIEITKKYLDLRLEELNLMYQFNRKREIEKDQQRAIKEQMLEEEKVRREIEQEKRKIEKEEIQFKNEQNKLLAYLNNAANDVERNIYADKIKELEEKIKLLEQDKKNVFDREANTRAGYVYIISNIGSFGDDVYKIGVTRRLEPMDRVKELGSASVPFEFDVHAMIFSDDAPALEATLHRHFRDKEVNKVNPRKEFFKVSLDEIESVVKENHNATVEFTYLAKAEEYRETLRLSELSKAMS